LKLLLGSFFLGAFSIAPAILSELLMAKVGFIENHLLLKTFLGIGLMEEGWKLFFILLVPFRRKAFNEPFDGIVYSVMVSMGFATVENILYVAQGGFQVGIMRAFTAIPAHAMFAVMMGYYLGRAKFSGELKGMYIFISLLVPVIFHGAYDYFLFEKSIPGIWLGAIISLVLGIILSFRAIRIHRKASRLAVTGDAEK
jgi:RsiW-degrading membrane proteinase PrsW (M82 family)